MLHGSAYISSSPQRRFVRPDAETVVEAGVFHTLVSQEFGAPVLLCRQAQTPRVSRTHPYAYYRQSSTARNGSTRSTYYHHQNIPQNMYVLWSISVRGTLVRSFHFTKRGRRRNSCKHCGFPDNNDRALKTTHGVAMI